MNIEQTFDYQVRSTLFSMMRMYNLLAQEHGITQGVGYSLMMIPKEGIPATKIAPAMGMGSSSLSRLLKGLENNKLIIKKISETDKRVTNIYLTEKGNKLRKTIKAKVIHFNQEILKQVSQEELEVYRHVSEAIRNQAQLEVDLKQQEKKNKI